MNRVYRNSNENLLFSSRKIIPPPYFPSGKQKPFTQNLFSPALVKQTVTSMQGRARSQGRVLSVLQTPTPPPGSTHCARQNGLNSLFLFFFLVFKGQHIQTALNTTSTCSFPREGSSGTACALPSIHPCRHRPRPGVGQLLGKQNPRV